jgi:hypothetical protein
VSTGKGGASAPPTPNLLEQHRDLLEASGISSEVARERGYWSATKRSELEKLGFKRFQQIVPALVIPIRDARGNVVNYQIRPDQPRIGENQRPVRYESPAGIPPTLDVPSRCALSLRQNHATLWITEGARKADAAAAAGLCCVSLPGVWSWAKRLNGDARQVLPDLQRVKLEDRQVVIAFDSDVMVKSQVFKALEALHTYLFSQGAHVRFLYLPELEPGWKTGLDDFIVAHGVEALWEHVEDELRPPPEPKPARPPLPTPQLLSMVERVLRTYVRFLDDHAPRAAALYALHTWALAAADCTPYLYVKSPQKRSGKTRLLESFELVCKGPLRAASVTEAAIFQVVETERPTFLIDEVDALFSSKSERAENLRGVLNAGNRRGAYVVRGSSEGVPLKFEIFCPKVLAGIDTGRLPDTIRDRAIVLPLERKLRTETVARYRQRDVADQIENLRTRLGDWAAHHADELAEFRTEMVPEISDRLEEAWEPLFAIAHLAGGPWPDWAREAAIELAKGTEDVGEDHGEILLAALRDVFDEARGEQEAMWTKDICKKLNEDDELPFGGYRDGKGIDGRGLSNRLRPYGIKPQNVQMSGEQHKGYRREQFEQAWKRYAPEPESVPPQDAADVPSTPSTRPPELANGFVEPNEGWTDSEIYPSTYPSTPKPASQSQNGPQVDGWTARTDEQSPSARTQSDGPCTCPRPARSPRADGPDLCMNCRRRMAAETVETD